MIFKYFSRMGMPSVFILIWCLRWAFIEEGAFNCQNPSFASQNLLQWRFLVKRSKCDGISMQWPDHLLLLSILPKIILTPFAIVMQQVCRGWAGPTAQVLDSRGRVWVRFYTAGFRGFVRFLICAKKWKIIILKKKILFFKLFQTHEFG